jgi:hypothetical protein
MRQIVFPISSLLLLLLPHHIAHFDVFSSSPAINLRFFFFVAHSPTNYKRVLHALNYILYVYVCVYVVAAFLVESGFSMVVVVIMVMIIVVVSDNAVRMAVAGCVKESFVSLSAFIMSIWVTHR